MFMDVDWRGQIEALTQPRVLEEQLLSCRAELAEARARAQQNASDYTETVIKLMRVEHRYNSLRTALVVQAVFMVVLLAVLGWKLFT